MDWNLRSRRVLSSAWAPSMRGGRTKASRNHYCLGTAMPGGCLAVGSSMRSTRAEGSRSNATAWPIAFRRNGHPLSNGRCRPRGGYPRLRSKCRASPEKVGRKWRGRAITAALALPVGGRPTSAWPGRWTWASRGPRTALPRRLVSSVSLDGHPKYVADLPGLPRLVGPAIRSDANERARGARKINRWRAWRRGRRARAG